MFAFDMNADEKRIKKIPLDPPLQMCVERGMALQINAWYDYTLSSIITAASNDLGEVSLSVTNLSTGETWYDTFDSSSTPQVVTPISGSTGTYEIVYITESGEVYEGNFML